MGAVAECKSMPIKVSLVAGALLVVFVIAGTVVATDMSADRTAWSELLERRSFRFRPERANLVSSMVGYSGEGVIQLTYNPKSKFGVDIKFIGNQSEPLLIAAHWDSVFIAIDNRLYFASFNGGATGCRLKAYDLLTGETLWESEELSGFDGVGHSAYRNQVTLRASQVNEIPGEIRGDSLVVTGHESYGDYVTIVDRESGKILASKIYRKGFAAP